MVVGKMKSTQFAMPEFAELAIDYQSPFNARADGYQDSGSSSSGPGSGMGSYPWLDLAIGSDTGGSLHVPAVFAGVYGNRPTHGMVELTDVVPLAPEIDTAGFIAHNATLWRTAAEVLYGSNLITNYTTYPTVIQTFGLPEAGAAGLTASDSLVLNFTNALADYLSAKVSVLNYTQRWSESHPANATADLETLLATHGWLFP